MIKSEKDKKKKVVIATVKSPSRDHHTRKGNGFSLREIKAAGKSIKLLKDLNIKIDYLRRSVHKANVEKLKELKPLIKKGKEKKPYTPKEKRVKTKKQKIKKKKIEIEKEPPTKTKTKPSAAIKEKTPAIKEKTPAIKEKTPAIKEKTPTAIKEKTPISTEPEKILITQLSGLGAATAKKFNDVGVNSVEDLIKEDPKELAMLISGVSEDRISKWVEEGKNLLNQ